MRYRQTVLATALAASTMLWSGCMPRAVVIPDPTVPHQLSEPIEKALVYVEKGDGKKVVQEIYIPKGWWIAGPPVVEPTTFDTQKFE